jgi:hypothetical protein
MKSWLQYDLYTVTVSLVLCNVIAMHGDVGPKTTQTILEERVEIRVLLRRGISTVEEVQQEFGRCKRTVDSIVNFPEAKRPKTGRPKGSFKAPPAYLHLLDTLIETNPEQFPQELRARMKRIMPEVCVSKKTVARYRSTVLDWATVKKTHKLFLTSQHKHARLLGCIEFLGPLRTRSCSLMKNSGS